MGEAYYLEASMNKVLTFTLGIFLSITTANASGKLCATVFQAANQSGYSLEIEDGQTIKDLNAYVLGENQGQMGGTYEGTWDNRISSLIVEPTCSLTGFQYQNYGINYETGEEFGSFAVFGSSDIETLYYDELSDFDNLISSLTCFCQQ